MDPTIKTRPYHSWNWREPAQGDAPRHWRKQHVIVHTVVEDLPDGCLFVTRRGVPFNITEDDALLERAGFIERLQLRPAVDGPITVEGRPGRYELFGNYEEAQRD